MKKRLLSLLLPAAFAVSSAHAAVFSSFGGEHDAVESGSEILFGAGAFSGMFDFTLSTDSLVTFTGGSTLPFLGFGLFDATDSLVSGTIFSPTTYENSFTSVSLGAGSYYYAPVFPSSGPNFSAYSFESYVTAVPEPETYALFLAGIGMLGYAAQRRMRGES
ncbi:MAG: PEP-CTERM sorting domain-containing protein [Rhodocyclaceae bacterium]|nr:PEP-CTERM sorting domain-containing protein [Rhodocyclaceae bacterium]